MKILITGASGFVGRNVSEYLRDKGYDIDTPGSSLLNCLNEETVKTFLLEKHYDIVLHFAVYGDGIDKSKDGTKVLEYNLLMFHNFAKNCNLYGRMIYTGSGAEYDKRYPIVKVTEEELGRTIPVDQYGLMKYTAQQIIDSCENIYNLRLFGIFGKYEHWKSKFISNVCCKAIKELPLTIRQNCYFDYLWIDDFCRMLEQFMMIPQPEYHSYNAVSGLPVDLKSLAEMVMEISGKKLPLYICRDGFANEYTANNSRIISELPGFKYTKLQEAVEELYNWYLKHETDIDLYSLIYG